MKNIFTQLHGPTEMNFLACQKIRKQKNGTLPKKFCLKVIRGYSLNLNQSKSTDYQ